MKRRVPSIPESGGILRWSTLCILAGGTVGLTSCDRDGYVATKEDVQVAAIQTRIETLDAEKDRLQQGVVANNFHIPRVGYYHAAVHTFHEHPYGFAQGGRFFVNGAWQDRPGSPDVPASRPSPEALKKVDAALTEEQKLASNSGATGHSGGFGMGNALMMYWLLAGNRGMFSPGAGFQQAGGNASTWQRDVEQKRGQVTRHASANPGYQRVVQQARASGQPVAAGQSVRGGFGSSRNGGGFMGG